MSAARDPQPGDGYHEVRRELLRRGYLQGRIERFVLADLLRRSAGPRAVWKTAARAAAMGGPLLGALLAGAAAATNTPLFRVADLAVLWVYFSLLAAATLLVLDLAVSALLTISSRRGARRGSVSRAAFLVAAPLLGYLLLWWLGRRPGGGVAGDLLFLAIAVATTALVAWLGGMVSLARIVGRTGEIPDRGRPAIVAVLVLAVPLAVLFFSLRAARSGSASESAASFAVPPADERWVVLGIDGLDEDLLDAMGPLGIAPRLRERLAASAVFPMRGAGAEPAEVWTTILTGVPAAVHGIESAGASRLPGVATPLREAGGPLPLGAALRFLLPARAVPTTGAGRRVRTLWEIVALERPVAAVGWWASWPAGEGAVPSGSYVVTDRVLPKLLAGARGDRDTSPEALFGRLAVEFPAWLEDARARFDDALPPAGESAAERALLRESFVIDGFARDTAETLLADPSVTAAFVYLPGLDILRFRLAAAADPGAGVRQTALVGRYLNALDGLLAGDLPGEPRTVRVADPGRVGAPGRGFVAVDGSPGSAGCRGSDSERLDVAPLVLSLVGFPASAEMPGRIPPGCPDRVAPESRERVPSFGRRTVPRDRPTSDYDDAMIERLRSLGYVR